MAGLVVSLADASRFLVVRRLVFPECLSFRWENYLWLSHYRTADAVTLLLINLD
jgi:hypothetical protein